MKQAVRTPSRTFSEVYPKKKTEGSHIGSVDNYEGERVLALG